MIVGIDETNTLNTNLFLLGKMYRSVFRNGEKVNLNSIIIPFLRSL